MSNENLNHFALVGGTALSLKHGHRKSIDLDLFSNQDFSIPELKQFLMETFERYMAVSADNAPGVFAFINDIKVDFVKYHYYPIIRPVEVLDNIRMLSDEDIAAMKIFAILKRAKKKDFWDINLLLEKFGIENVISFYREKYPSSQMIISIQHAILYFDEADLDEDPVCLNGLTWEQIKMSIKKQVNNYLK